MPASYTTHTVASTASGSDLQFSVNYPYILRSHVKVYYGRDILAGTHTSLLVDGNDYNWTTDTQITLTAAPSSTSTLTIIRETPTDAQQVVWQDGSNLIADDLNTADRQNLYVVQEQQDRNALGATEARNATTASNAATAAVNTALLADGTRAMTGNLNADSNKVVNLANPTAGGDAVNKTFADATYQPLDAELTELATMAGNTASALADLTQAEVNILDGATVSTSELNTLDGITASTAELNKLDGVTSSTAELNILDGVTATAAEINALDGITASVDELNKLDGVTATTAELNFVDGVTSGIQAQLDAKQPLDAELTELATMQSTTASALADLTQAEVQILDGATVSTTELNTLDGITSTTTELNVLDGVTATTTELNVTDGLTASTSELNQLDGKTISSTLTPANTNDIPTSSAVNTFVSGLLNALGGFVAIPNEISFPTTNPDPSDNAGTVVSIADAGGVVVNSSGVSTTGRTTGNATVTITGFPSSLQSTTLGAGLGLQVQTTSTLNTYTYHKLIAKEADVKQLSDDINDFQSRYRVSANAPTTDLDAGDLWFDTTAGKMKVYDANDSAWEEVQSVGNFFINTLSSSSGTGGGSATFNGSAYRFTLSNAGANAQQMLVSVNGVIQKPNSGTSQPSEGFAIENNDIIFAAAPASGASHFIVTLGSTVNIGQPSNNTVDTSELVDGAVTNAKVSSSAAIAGTKISPDFGSQNVVTTGSAGIGTASPSAKLHSEVASGEAIRASASGAAQHVWSRYVGGSGNPADLKVGVDSSAGGVYGVGGGGVVWNAGNGPLGFGTNDTERMRIDSSGRLLVSGQASLTSTSLSHPVQIAADSSAQNIVCFGRALDDISAIDFYEADKTTNLGEIQYRRDHVNFRHRVGEIRFATGGTTDRMIIDSSGKVGINETNPQTYLHIDGGGAEHIRVSNGSNSLTILNDSVNSLLRSTGPVFYRAGSLLHIFQNEDGTSEAMRINSAGNLGVGTSAPGGRIGVPIGENSLICQTASTAHSASNVGSIRLTISDGGGHAGVYVNNTHNGTYSSQNITFLTAEGGISAATERMRILSSGGLTFNGDTAQANALDDYEEGTWTPQFATNGVANSGATYATQVGQYTKIGNTVFVRCRCTMTNKGTLHSSTAIVGIIGLPFTVRNTGEGWIAATVGYASGTWNTAAPNNALFAFNSTGLNLYTHATSSAHSTMSSAVLGSYLSNSSDIILSGTYITDA